MSSNETEVTDILLRLLVLMAVLKLKFTKNEWEYVWY